MDLQNLTETEKDKKLNRIIEILENKMGSTRDKKELSDFRKKINAFTRINLMRQKLKQEHEDLRKKYLVITKERNLYFEKLSLIEKLGSDCNWDDPKSSLYKIKEILEKQSSKFKI